MDLPAMGSRLALVLALVVRITVPHGSLDATAISQAISDRGPSEVLRSLYENNEDWSHLLAWVATGREEWLAIANRLYPAADAGSSEQLLLAVGEALEHRPANVLRLAVPVFSIGVCGAPDVDDPRYDSYELAMKAIAKRTALLQTVTEASLRQVRQKCESELDSSKAGIAAFYGRTNN